MGTTPPTHACAVRFMNFGAETKFEKWAVPISRNGTDRNSTLKHGTDQRSKGACARQLAGTYLYCMDIGLVPLDTAAIEVYIMLKYGNNPSNMYGAVSP